MCVRACVSPEGVKSRAGWVWMSGLQLQGRTEVLACLGFTGLGCLVQEEAGVEADTAAPFWELEWPSFHWGTGTGRHDSRRLMSDLGGVGGAGAQRRGIVRKIPGGGRTVQGVGGTRRVGLCVTDCVTWGFTL